MNKKISFLFLVILLVGFVTYFQTSSTQAEVDPFSKTEDEGAGGEGDDTGSPGGGGGAGAGEGFGPGPGLGGGEAQTSRYLFGWAWGGTSEGSTLPGFPHSGVGWIKFNSCEDKSPRDGLPDGGCVPQFGVVANMNSGNLSGHAWSSHVGWISFNRSETGDPPSDDPGAGSGSIAKITMNGDEQGRVRGWARAISAIGDPNDGWDGWIHLSDNTSSPPTQYNPASPKHPSGPAYFQGNAGVTYVPAAGVITGYAWGSHVVGWVRFVGVTLGAPTTSFDYGLSNSGDIQIPKSSQGQVAISRNLISGTAESVSISITSPSIPGVTATLGGNNPCAPYCLSNITFTVGSNAVPDTYNVTVRGVSSVTQVTRETSFNLTVTEPTPTNLSIVCSAEGNPPYLINKKVTWMAEVMGSGEQAGTPPYTAEWQFVSENEGTVEIPAGASQEEKIFTIDRTYLKIGEKRAIATITDSSSPERVGVCQNTAPINVVVDTNIIEN